jgi:exportin-2 (importin alpha re-exporter)
MAELQEIGQLLQQSLNPTSRKSAEATLREKEAQPGFSILLLHVVASQSLDEALRLAAALYFKNFIKRNWTVGFPPCAAKPDHPLTAFTPDG